MKPRSKASSLRGRFQNKQLKGAQLRTKFISVRGSISGQIEAPNLKANLGQIFAKQYRFISQKSFLSNLQ